MPPISIDYQREFENFISHTNEENTLYLEILRTVKRLKVQSLLDIGAGNGLLSVRLSREVAHYLAVEENPYFAERLRMTNIPVIERVFPFPTEGTYDFVLISHSLPQKEGQTEQFLNEAWKSVNVGGSLLIVTYRMQRDNWAKLLQQIGEDISTHNRARFDSIVGFIVSLTGNVEVKKVMTAVSATTVTEMIETLSFVASNGETNRKDQFMKKSVQIQKILEAEYRKGGEYSFPFQNFFISARKKK